MGKTDYSIRLATKKDQDSVSNFRYKLDIYEHANNSSHPKPTKEEVATSIASAFKNKYHFFYIAEFGNKPVGFGEVLIKTSSPKVGQKRGVFEGLWIEPEYRRRGIAKALSLICLKKLREYDLESIKGYVRPKNLASIQNVEKLGGKHTLNVYSFRTK